MSLREKLQKVKQQKLYKLQTPDCLKEENLIKYSKDWLSRQIDITDYFNYGFNDATFKLYLQKLEKWTDSNLSKLQKEYTNRAILQKAKVFHNNIPTDFGGFSISFDPQCLPPEGEFLKDIFLFDAAETHGEILYNNETFIDIFRHYKNYLEDLVSKNQFFSYESVYNASSKEKANWQELQKLLLNKQERDSSEKKKKYEKKKVKKEKKIKKEKKKKHKKKSSKSSDSPQIVPQQIIVNNNTDQTVNNVVEIEYNLDSESDNLSKQNDPIISQPIKQVKLEEEPQKNLSSEPLSQQQASSQQPSQATVTEPVRFRNNNWPRNLIQGILQGNKNQLRR